MNIIRFKRLQSAIERPILIKKKENLLYLTGRSFDYRTEEYLLVRKSGVVGFGSGLEQMDWIKKSDSLKNIGKYVKGNRQLDIEFKFTYGEGAYLMHKLPGVKIKPVYSPADKLRMIKEPGEIALVKKSMQIVEKVFERVKHHLHSNAYHRHDLTEARLAKFITETGFKFGAEDIAFPAIVASGANAAIPHHVPSGKKLKAGESIIIDFGFKYKNYCSDFTRTIFLKKVPNKLEMAYNQVEKAYNQSIDFINNGMPRHAATKVDERTNTVEARRGVPIKAGDVYQKSVDVLKEKHLEKYFIHSLGHGTGLEIHELPNLSPKSKDFLADGMVFSIEPGVYFPKLGGIRIEDLVYLEKGNVKKFIKVPTELSASIIN